MRTIRRLSKAPLAGLFIFASVASCTWIYGYDLAGNRTSATHPNGLATAYEYDARNHFKDDDPVLLWRSGSR